MPYYLPEGREDCMPEEQRKVPVARLGLMVVAFVAMVVGFRAMLFSHLPGIFNAVEEDMDYAWFVPLFSIAVLWSERQRLRESLGAPGFGGVLLAIPCLALGIIGARGLQVRFELLAFVGLLVAVPWALFGRRMAKVVAFPVLCLLFCMPMASYLSLFTVHLRLVASAVSEFIVSILGVDVIRQGNLISLPGVILDDGPFAIDIANPCSGLRSIVALMAISVGYGYYTQPTWLRRVILSALSIPIAVIGNVTRIVSICLVAKSSSASFAIGFYHDFSGFVVFAAAILLLVAAGSAIDAVAGKMRGKDDELRMTDDELGTGKGNDELRMTNCGCGRGTVVALLAVLLPVMAFQSIAPKPVLTEAPEINFPVVEGFKAEWVEPSTAETNVLRGATIDKRVYKMDNGFWFQVTAVTSGESKGSLHSPELCLPSQGFDMGVGRIVVEKGVEWRLIPLTAKGDMPDALFAYTFFNQEGYRTSRHESRIWRDVWDRTVHNRIDRWVMITVHVPIKDEAFMRGLMRILGGMVK